MLAFEAAGTIGMMRSAHHAWASCLLALASQRLPANPMMSRWVTPPPHRTDRRMHRPICRHQRSISAKTR
jgi:hypothetical protein